MGLVMRGGTLARTRFSHLRSLRSGLGGSCSYRVHIAHFRSNRSSIRGAQGRSSCRSLLSCSSNQVRTWATSSERGITSSSWRCHSQWPPYRIAVITLLTLDRLSNWPFRSLRDTATWSLVLNPRVKSAGSDAKKGPLDRPRCPGEGCSLDPPGFQGVPGDELCPRPVSPLWPSDYQPQHYECKYQAGSDQP